VIEGPLETSAIMDSPLIRDQRGELIFAQDQRREELRLAQDQRTALREKWRSTKQTFKPIAESVKAVLLPYVLEESTVERPWLPFSSALKAQVKNQDFISVLDDDWPPAESNHPRDKQISYYMGRTGEFLFRFWKGLVNVKYESEEEDAEAEIKPIKDLIKLMEVSNC
jgi:hypothetical protein